MNVPHSGEFSSAPEDHRLSALRGIGIIATNGIAGLVGGVMGIEIARHSGVEFSTNTDLKLLAGSIAAGAVVSFFSESKKTQDDYSPQP